MMTLPIRFLAIFAAMIVGVMSSQVSESSSIGPTDSQICTQTHGVVGQNEMKQTVLGQYYSIGYVSLDMVAKDPTYIPGTCGVEYGSMINAAGNKVSATPASLQSAVLVGPSTCPGFGLCAEIFDTPSPTGWPMTFLSYVALPTKLQDNGCQSASTFDASCTKCVGLKTAYDYLKWILVSSDAASILNDNSFAPLPEYVVARIESEIFPYIQCAGRDGNYTRIIDWPSGVQAWSIIGGGTSVQAGVQVQLSNAFNIQTSVSISFLAYNPSKKQLNDGDIVFELRDVALDQTDLVVIQQGQVMIPVMAAAVVPIYNLEQKKKLTFPRSWLSGVFLGSVTSWSDRSLLAANPSYVPVLKSPIRIVRADSTVQDGIAKVFAQSIFSFANVSASDYHGPNPSSVAVSQSWPTQTVHGDTPTCFDKKCSIQVCQAGYYFNVELNDCEQCPLGTFSILSGSLTCEPCPPGTYANVAGSKTCTKCNDVSFQPASGSQSCLTCPENTRRYGVPTRNQSLDPNLETYVFGAHLEECMCLPNFWAPETVNHTELGGVPCVQCPDGAVCAGFNDGIQNIPVPEANFWGDPTSPSVFFECGVGHCPGGYNCSEGFTGRLCADTAPGYYTVAGLVHKCQPESPAYLVFFVILEVIGWIVLVNFACSQYASLSIDMIMLQTSGYIAKLNLRWNPELEVIRLVASYFNFEVGFVGLQCRDHSVWTKQNLFYWQISFPFISILLCAFWWLLKTAMKRLAQVDRLGFLLGHSTHNFKVIRVIKNKASLASIFHTSENFLDYIWIKSLMFFLTWFPVMVFTVFSIFKCEKDAKGDEYLFHMPDMVCWDESHWTMIYVACAYIPLVIVAVPLILARRLYWGLKADLLNRCAFMESYGWIYSKYKCDYAWWEMAVLLRRALICIVAAFSNVPMVSACMIIVILNFFLCCQLVLSPHLQAELRYLEIGSLFSCMIQAVAGVLLYPSLDASDECVGSTYLDEVGSTCDSNNQIKHVINILVLTTYSCNLVASVGLFLWKFILNWKSDAAVRTIHHQFDIPYDYYDIHLSNVINGPYLASAVRDPALMTSEEFKERYLNLNSMIPYFIMFNHDQSGHYSQHEFARTLNKLLQSFPGLLDWLVQAERKFAVGFHAFLLDYAAYAREHHNVTFGEILLPSHKADVLMWLMTCSDRNITTFCRLMHGVASASGMNYFLRPGKVRDQLLNARQYKVLGLKRKSEGDSCKELTPHHLDGFVFDSAHSATQSAGLLELINVGNPREADDAEQSPSIIVE